MERVQTHKLTLTQAAAAATVRVKLVCELVGAQVKNSFVWRVTFSKTKGRIVSIRSVVSETTIVQLTAAF